MNLAEIYEYICEKCSPSLNPRSPMSETSSKENHTLNPNNKRINTYAKRQGMLFKRLRLLVNG